MRLDKYLKVSRLIKRRTVACDACTAGRVDLNGKTARPSAEVRPGDDICIRFGSSTVHVKVTSIEENTGKASAKDMYEIMM